MTLEIIKSLILGTVEGLTEFLPISSTGHLIILNQWLHFGQPFTFVFDVVIQLGAILAVVIYFREKLWPFSHEKEERRESAMIWSKALLGVAPALIAGALLGNFVETKLFNYWVVALSLIIGGIVLLFIEQRPRQSSVNSLAELSYKKAFAIGLIQCLAIIPGTSRAAATIIGAMLLGGSRTVATEFSFFLAIPTMAAASAYSLAKYGLAITAAEGIILAVGFLAALFVALAAIRFLLNYVQKNDFKPFGYYRIALGLAVLAIFLLK